MSSNDVEGDEISLVAVSSAVVWRVADNTGVCDGIPDKLGMLVVGITVS